MKSKINNSLKEEYKDIETFVRETKSRLKIQKKASTIAWSILSSLMFTLNIALLVLSSYALMKVLGDYNESTKNIDFTKQVLPTISVSAFSILLFIFSIVISFYQGKMKSNIYKEAYEDIQYKHIQFIESKEKDEKKIKKEINNIYVSAIESKKHRSLKKIIYSIMTGGDDE